MTSIQSTRRALLKGAAAAGLASVSLPLTGRPARALEKVKIITTSGNLTWQEVLKQKGYLEALGVESETLHVSDATKITGALLAGEADIAIATGFSQLFPAIQRGAKIKILAGGIILGQQTIYSKRPEIRTVADLAGKTIGVGSLGAQLHQIMVAILEKKGVKLDSVKFVNIGSSADIFKAVVAGTIDGGPGTIDVFQDQARYGVHSLTDGNFWEQLPEYAFQASYATQRTIDTKRDLLVKTLAAYCQLYRFISAPGSKDMFVQARQKTLSKFDAASAAEGAYQWDFFQKYQIFAKDLVLSDRQIAFQQELNVQLGAQERVLSFDQVADMSLAQDALKLVASKT